MQTPKLLLSFDLHTNKWLIYYTNIRGRLQKTFQPTNVCEILQTEYAIKTNRTVLQLFNAVKVAWLFDSNDRYLCDFITINRMAQLSPTSIAFLES
jgi:hypothetical protein